MALFNIDIERYYLIQKEEGFDLKSIAYIQYPIYCIHSSIIDSTPDPLEKLDKVIIKSLLLRNDISILEIAQLLSIQKKAVELRIQQMKNEGLIKGRKTLRITAEGMAILIEGTEKRIRKRPHDFYLDGMDFSPLNSKLYSQKYLNSFFNENEYTYYTDARGETKTSKPFKPNIVHEPLIKEKVIENILRISEEERSLYAIPLGLEEIESIDFTKMSMPILVGLMVKDGKPYRKLIDGFSTIGEPEKIISFKSKIEDKINNLELRLDTWKDKKTEEQKFSFSSNWPEIDLINEDQKVQFISSEDLKLALTKFYKIDNLSDGDIINSDIDIGINVTKGLLLKLKNNKKQFLRNIERGRDYQMFSTNNGVWLVFITFKTNCPFVNSMVEILMFLRNSKDKNLKFCHITDRLFKYESYRQALVFLEEFELLERIDINQNMYMVEDE